MRVRTLMWVLGIALYHEIVGAERLLEGVTSPPTWRCTFRTSQIQPAFNVPGPTTGWGRRRITYSFAREGANGEALATKIRPRTGEPNVLFSRMNECFGSEQIWQDIIHGAFRKWSSGADLEFIFCSDDGKSFGEPGEGMKRGDIRFWCYSNDGEGYTKAESSPPLHGDVRFDKAERWDPALLERVAFHEIGHALGLKHSCPPDGRKAMERSETSALFVCDDDLRGVHVLYGDSAEPNNHFREARKLTVAQLRAAKFSIVHGAASADLDFILLNLQAGKEVDIVLAPIGERYQVGDDNESGCQHMRQVDTKAEADLTLEVLDSNEKVLKRSNNPVGQSEEIKGLRIPPDGKVILNIFSASPAQPNSTIQVYEVIIQE